MAWKVVGYAINDAWGSEHRVLIYRNNELVGTWRNMPASDGEREREIVLYVKDHDVLRFAVARAGLNTIDVEIGSDQYLMGDKFPIDGTVTEGATEEYR
ncbi:hypothetical protein HGA91_02560 [candidate division WWE3 bacterium]|nr:hypothetical protein [candidate division WWE3 bacterium]